MVDTPAYDESGMPIQSPATEYAAPEYSAPAAPAATTAPAVTTTTAPTPTATPAAAAAAAAQIQAQQAAATVQAVQQSNGTYADLLKNPLILGALAFGALLLLRGK